jgi:N-acetylneuraminic acid mutarotase
MNTLNILKVFVVVIMSIASICPAVEDTWTRKSDMPTRRLGLSTSVVNGKIYAIGGGYSIEGPHSKIVEEYNPVTDTWSRKADMPTGRIGHAASVVNGKIYVIGGDIRPEVSCSTVEEYDPSTNTWATRADMPTQRTFLCACAMDGMIYAIGGIKAPEMHTLSTVEVYNPATDTWATKSNMPTPRYTLSTCTLNGQIYAVGGFGNIVEKYDPATDTWVRKADMLTVRTALSTCVVNGKIYAIGGASAQTGPVLKTVEEYDSTTDTWTIKADMSTTRWFFSTSALDGNIYAIGGSTGYPPHSSVSSVEVTALQPDFNGDGIVDIKDLLRLIGSWNQDDSLLDIAPPPFGDEIVDALDLELLMSYWKQPVDDPTLLAHWELDETEGIIAYDSAGVNDAVVLGGTMWQPNSGQIDGALHLDGIDGYAIANPVMNPADGSFSVFVWIKSGEPGQVVISQQNGFNWLGIDPDLGCLMTELMAPAIGRFTPKPLISECVVTDDQWHRIGFVWDGFNRSLYVDDVLVAEDTQANLQDSNGGLYIGTGKATEPGTYFSGLIDDVRIYNRAVSP